MGFCLHRTTIPPYIRLCIQLDRNGVPEMVSPKGDSEWLESTFTVPMKRPTLHVFPTLQAKREHMISYCVYSSANSTAETLNSDRFFSGPNPDVLNQFEATRPSTN